MSSTSAVAVLAQGLRDLRDFAEGPDGEDLRQRTGLTTRQIDAALAGEQLPTREVTLALVGAWEGDVEAWREYWAQIAELVRAEGGQGESGGAGRKRAVPVAPEPSIITALVAGDGEAEPGAGPAADGADGGEADAAAAEPAADAPEADGVEAARAEGVAEAEGSVAQSGEVEGTAAAAVEAKTAESVPKPAGEESAQEPVDGGAAASPAQDGASETDSRKPVDAGPAVKAAASPSAAQVPPRTPSGPPNKRGLARAGVSAALFAAGVAVGAFGDHALSSKSSSQPTSASVPTASQGSSSGSTASTASRSSSQPSSSGTTSSSSAVSSSSSASSSSTSSGPSSSPSGATLGTYTGIQLASGYSVDFLNDTSHPTSGTADGPDSMGFFATSFVDGRFYADQVAILDPQDTGSYAACRNDTRYQHDVLLSQVSAGTSFCIHTETGHLVLVTVRRMPSSMDANPYAVVDLTVWQN